ncbi:hypothetical protein BCR44DRAFT_1509226 [Catenaria anguillulae PL171]|uniref:Sm domain-containing protein n=1 Tax=Catenaria anguillulae PL171 TaxID=765915 RepID=A0A1Y2I1V4_9FUNG|nr:hypothetical protein BCR44DRAFT_1509226 [Catenaria anguillulae PL171]
MHPTQWTPNTSSPQDRARTLAPAAATTTKAANVVDTTKAKAVAGAAAVLETVADVVVAKRIVVKFIGGREVSGVLTAFDPLNNLVLEEWSSLIPKGAGQSVDRKRNLGTIVARGQQIMALAPEDGYVEIDNPFLMDDDE